MESTKKNWESKNWVENKMGKPEDRILQLLKDGEALTLLEIAEKLNEKPKTVFKLLRKLFENNEVNCDIKTRQYMLSKKEWAREHGILPYSRQQEV